MPSDIKDKVEKFFTQYPLRTFVKRQLLIQAESDIGTVFYIVEGRVSQYDITPSGREVVVNVFKPGVFFPMSSAINNTPNHYFFKASTEVSAHVVPAADAVRFLKDNPDVLFDLLARVYRGVDGVLRRMAHLMGGDSRSRLIFELLNAAYRFGETRSNDAVFVGLKESDLARHSGLARETVSRVLQDLKTAGLVDIERGGTTIKNLPELEAKLGAAL
jgi:CRP-like cAMP-binding protein